MSTPQGPPPGPPQGPPPAQQPGSPGWQPGPGGPGGPQVPRAGEPEPRKRSISIGQILGGILLVLVVVFIFENTDDVKVRLIVPQYTMPVALPIVIAAVLGALIAWLLRYRRRRNHPSRKTKAARRDGSVS